MITRGTYNINSQIKFKTSILESILCDYSDTDIVSSGTIRTNGTGNDDAARRLDERNKGAIFKNCDPFSDCISEINNTQTDNAK